MKVWKLVKVGGGVKELRYVENSVESWFFWLNYSLKHGLKLIKIFKKFLKLLKHENLKKIEVCFNMLFRVFFYQKVC